MRPVGKIGLLRQRVRRAWIRANPPNHEGYYICGICHKWVAADEMALDHIKPSGKYKELMEDFDNLQPTHGACNTLKGSRDMEELTV